ncbi:MAG: hypothetical protein IJY09_02715 [Lachnospiraceae bacterium]|nr:hypothetical protein [Lachnospiraceae bacterium]
MVENIYNSTEAQVTEYQTEGRKIPKNLRQIGYFTSNLRVYIEDYVYTFSRWLAEQDYSGRCAAVLVGEFAKSEHTRDVYAYGCVVMKNVCQNGKIEITGDTWGNIYENIKEYFPDGEIVGWFYGGTSFMEEEKEMLTQIHLDHFAGSDRILMLYDFLEKEEEIYRYEEGSLTRQNGYYIYYEKNEEMQSYMIFQKQGGATEEVDDRVVRQMRAKFGVQRKDANEEAETVDAVAKRSGKSGQTGERFFYTTGIAVAAVAVMMGAAVVYNQERLAGFEQTLNQMLDFSDGKDETEKGSKDAQPGQEQVAEGNSNIFEEPLAQETFGNQSNAEKDGKQKESQEEVGAENGEGNSGVKEQDETTPPQDMEQQPQITEDEVLPTMIPEQTEGETSQENDEALGSDVTPTAGAAGEEQSESDTAGETPYTLVARIAHIIFS